MSRAMKLYSNTYSDWHRCADNIGRVRIEPARRKCTWTKGFGEGMAVAKGWRGIAR